MAETGNPRESVLSCDDFGLFQEALKKMRTIDDRIIYALNQTIPTDSFGSKVNATEKCQELYNQLSDAHSQRKAAVQRCVSISAEQVEKLRDERDKDRDNIPVFQRLRKEQFKLRLMRQELIVEEVVKDKTDKAFYERCRNHYIPPSV